MNENIESLYSQVAQKAIELIPTKWSKILLHAEIFPGVVTETHYFTEKDTGKTIQFGDIPNIYAVERSKFNNESFRLTKLIRQLNKEFLNSNQEKWTSMTFVLASDGEFNIDYSYENLSESEEAYRREVWERKYLNI